MSVTGIQINMKKVILPSNRGYIINDRKYYGKQNYINNGENVKLISPDKHIHTWVRRGYVESINNNKFDIDSLGNSVNPNRQLVSSRSMMPCPAELYNSGLCLERHNTGHLKYYYHFARYKNGHIVTNGNSVEYI